jgi:hypothetical protein
MKMHGVAAEIAAFFDGRYDGPTSPDMFVTIARKQVVAVNIAVGTLQLSLWISNAHHSDR